MDDAKKFHHASYQRHEDMWQDFAPGGDKEAQAKTWLQDDTVDAWRHHRMYATIDPLLEMYPRTSWLTVGDGRYGNDAHYLLSKGLEAVTATDISDTLLREAKEIGFIKSFSKENAEGLSFANETFDFVLCKESYHHFPRPMLALYEMLRVARLGVILIEPNDGWLMARAALQTPKAALAIMYKSFKFIIKWILGKVKPQETNTPTRGGYGYEETGNFVYAISRWEIEKVAAGMHFPTVAFKGLNDHYIKGVEFEKQAATSTMFQEVKRTIALQDERCRLQRCDYSLLVAIIFKDQVEPAVKDRLRAGDYEVVDLPKNPYL